MIEGAEELILEALEHYAKHLRAQIDHMLTVGKGTEAVELHRLRRLTETLIESRYSR